MAQNDFNALRELLPSVLAEVARNTGRARQLKPVWDEIVGGQIARVTTPLTFEGTTLVVSVASPRWAHELEQREGDLKARLAQRLGKGTVSKISFRLAG